VKILSTSIAGVTLLWLSLAVRVPAFGQGSYSGPSILSRGEGMNFGRASDFSRIRPFVRVQGFYDSDITNISADEEGSIPRFDGKGVMVGFGAYGSHSWRRSVLFLDYSGQYRHYTRRRFFNGTDHQLGLGFSHQPSRRWTLTARQSGGVFMRNFFNPGSSAFFDPEFAYTPEGELFDNRTFFAQTMGDATYQASSRLSLNFGGDGFVVRRRSAALANLNGARARSDMAYRLGQNSTISLVYSYTYFDFTRVFGSSNFHSVESAYSTRLSRYWDLSLMGGVSRVESQGLRVVQLDPVVAAILGQGRGVEAFYRVITVPTGQARLTRRFQRGAFYISGGQRVNAGNGLLLTSRGTFAGIGANKSFTRNVSVGVRAGYRSFSSLTRSLQKMETYDAAANFSYRLSRSMHFISSVNLRRLDFESSRIDRTMMRVSAGFAFSPGDVPLAFW
jgi:hypothetical protein